MSCDGSVGKITKLLLNDMGQNSFLSPKVSRLAQVCTHPAIAHVPGVLSPRVKLPRHEADRSPPSTAKVKNEWSHTSTLPILP
jgi:hypothetical protein